ncbi:MAG: gamma-glutamyl-gamma-aminobutyrate hydrolase family protein [Bacteroidales bacterium]
MIRITIFFWAFFLFILPVNEASVHNKDNNHPQDTRGKFIPSGLLPEQSSGKQIKDNQDKFIVIMHPTVDNIRTWIYLTSEGILPVEPDIKLLGVYSDHASYDYSRTDDYIRMNGYDHISLLGIGSSMEIDHLFSENVNTEIFRMVFQMAKGILFFGGPDIPPAIYGDEMNLLTVVTDPHRHYLEVSFLFHLLGGYQNEDHIPFLEENRELPLLGICLGMQTMNVTTGGTMIQDIPSDIYGKNSVEQVLAMDSDQQHRNYYSAFRIDQDVAARSFHRILVEEESHLEQVLADNQTLPYVLSSHHQAIDRLGKGFWVTARSSDSKIIEAIEHVRYPNVMGIQFHPEVITLYEQESSSTLISGNILET